MFLSEEDHQPLATMAEAATEYAINVGRDLAESGDTTRAWVLSPYDTWESNPFYVGPPVPHPEDYHPEDEDEVWSDDDARLAAQDDALATSEVPF